MQVIIYCSFVGIDSPSVCMPCPVQNALLPAGLRQKDQTKKAPTGTFQRDNLLAHLEKQAKEHPDKEDLVPFTGEKRGGSVFSKDHLAL